MQGDTDISWQDLGRIFREWAGASAELAEVQTLPGGSINTTLLLRSKCNQCAVLKITPHRVTQDFEREAMQLDLLRSLGVPTPEVYIARTATLDDPNSFILMEYVDGINLHDAKRKCDTQSFDGLQSQLAEIVIRMHEETNPTYSRVGLDSPPFENWSTFYRSIYEPIWKEVEKSNVLPIKQKRMVGKLHERLDRYLATGDSPRLVHWDIWSTNVLAKCDGGGNWSIAAVIDPNCKYAHAEAEIAYLDLFHTSTPVFNRAYQQRFKLPEDYHRVRKPIYQLYQLLNHVNLFGGDNSKSLAGVMERVGQIV